MSGFGIDRPFLSQMLEDIGEGKIQLPDFQRGWVWDDERIRSLIASVSQEFPIGSVLILNPTGTDVRFIPRLVKGVNSNRANTEPDTFILDGQQRLTALYQALMSRNSSIYERYKRKRYSPTLLFRYGSLVSIMILTASRLFFLVVMTMK